MQLLKNLFSAFIFVVLLGCSMNKNQVKEDESSRAAADNYEVSETEGNQDLDAITGATKAKISFAVLAGGSYGGLVHNENMHGISGVSDVDAITGATNLTYNAGIHTILKGHGRTIETGLDYVNLNKSIEYEMPSLLLNGTRNFELYQLRLPVTYNFGFFKNNLDQSKLVLKVGLSAGYTFSKTIEDSENSENMPEYEFSNWDLCGKFSLCFYPFDFKQNYRLGFYFDAYRGFKAYDDIYHESAYLGGNAFAKFGVIFEP
jgi:hypothetical protein